MGRHYKGTGAQIKDKGFSLKVSVKGNRGQNIRLEKTGQIIDFFITLYYNKSISLCKRCEIDYSRGIKPEH